MMETQINRPSLQARNLSCVRNNLTLFNDLNLSLNAGEALQIEGANGSGKTSLLRILCGLSQPAEGEVLWCENNIRLDRISFYNNLVYIGHHHGIKDDLSCEENLAMFCSLGNTRENISIDSTLEQIGLLEKDETPARRLSAGQRRRLALARLLISKAPLWILDEPLTALDPLARNMMEHHFSQHCQQGGMIIFTTHHPIKMENVTVRELRIGQ